MPKEEIIMKIQYLGTAAAEGIPAIFCECETCKKTRERGGKNIRTRSQALIDDTILIDLPADTYLHFLQFNVPMHTIKTCLITHNHADHLYTNELEMRKKGFAHLEMTDPLTLYSDQSAYDAINKTIAFYNISESDVVNKLLVPGVTFEVEGYKVTPVRASHNPKSSPVVFAIEKDGKSFLYGNDTSELIEESMNALKALGHPLDMISLDCTEACNHAEYIGHMSLERCIAFRDTLKKEGIADENTVFILNHFSHNSKNVLYDDFVEIAKEHDFLVTYDGMVYEF